MADPVVTYRDRAPGELGEAVVLLERVFREEFDLPLGPRLQEEISAIESAFDARRDLFATAEADGRTVGVLLVTDAHFSWLAVDPALRGRGIGRELVARGIEACRQRRLVVLEARTFASSPAAPHLYWLYGFRVVDIVPTPVGERMRETLLFEKRLTPPAETV